MLMPGALADDAEVHVAVRPGVSSGVRTEQVNSLQWHDAIERLQAAPERFPLAVQARRKILKHQSHDYTLARLLTAGKRV